MFLFTRPLAAGFGDLGEILRDIADRECWQNRPVIFRDFGNVRKCASSDVEGSRVGNRKRPPRQKRDTGTNLIAAQMAKIFGRGRDFCQPARCFFQFVTE